MIIKRLPVSIPRHSKAWRDAALPLPNVQPLFSAQQPNTLRLLVRRRRQAPLLVQSLTTRIKYLQAQPPRCSCGSSANLRRVLSAGICVKTSADAQNCAAFPSDGPLFVFCCWVFFPLPFCSQETCEPGEPETRW